MSLLSVIYASRSKISAIKLFWTHNKFMRFHGVFHETLKLVYTCPFYLVSYVISNTLWYKTVLDSQ